MAAGTRPPRRVRRYHFHLPGVLYVGVTVFLSVGALNSQNNLLFLALGLAIGGLLVSGVLSGMSLMGIEVERTQALDTAVGRPLVVVYTIRNRNRFVPAFGLSLRELPGPDAGEAWMPALSRPIAHVAHLGPRQTVHAEAVVWPESRGRLVLQAVQVWTAFPFGIAKKSVTFPQVQSLVVRPLVIPLRGGAIEERRRRVERGATGGRFAGPGDEFWALREYVPGDLPRHIAWRATARTGQLLVTQRAAPSPTRAWIVLCLSGNAAQPQNERAVCLAASLIQRALEDGMAVGLAVRGSEVLRAPASHRWHVDRLLNELAEVSPPESSPIGDFPGMAARSGACIVVWAAHPDRSWGPSGCRHFSGSDFERLAAGPQAVDQLQGLAGAPLSNPSTRLAGAASAFLKRIGARAGGGAA